MWRTPRGHVFSRDRTLDTETKAYARRLADSVDISSVEQRCTAYSSVYQLEQGSERERTKTVSCCWPWGLCPDPTPTREKGSDRFRAIYKSDFEKCARETHVVTFYRNVYKSCDAKLKLSPPPLLIGMKSLLFGKKGLAFVDLNALGAYQTGYDSS